MLISKYTVLRPYFAIALPKAYAMQFLRAVFTPENASPNESYVR